MALSLYVICRMLIYKPLFGFFYLIPGFVDSLRQLLRCVVVVYLNEVFFFSLNFPLVRMQARTGKLPEEGVRFVGSLSGWTATLMFMWMPVSQMV